MAAAQQGNQSDNSASIIWSIAAIFAGLYVVWRIFQKQLAIAYLMLKLYEMNFVSLFTHHFEQTRLSVVSALTTPQTINLADLMRIGDSVGDILKYPFTALLIILAFVVYFGSTSGVFRRNYSMKDLAKLEKVNWPQICPVVDMDLLRTDIDKGPWAMAMTPMQFCKRYKLLDEVSPLRREGMNRRDWDKIDVVLKRGVANKLFALQIGQVWRGVDKLPPHIKALFAVFAARINEDSKPAAEMLSRLSASAGTKLDLTGVDVLLKKYVNTKLVQRIVQSHAYVLTVMASMLEGARKDGVQASADFLWLKPVDRRLWYTLNTVGRQTPFIEVGGVFAHWLAEKEAGGKLLVPAIEEATKALEVALTEVVYRKDEVI